MQIVNVGILWSDDAEAAFKKFAAENQNGVFPATRENFVQAVFQNSLGKD